MTKDSAAGTEEGESGCRLVYLLSQYPAVSHTFFLNEVRELRKIGFTVEVASINQPDRSRSSMPAVEVEEADKTFYIKSTGAAWAAWIAEDVADAAAGFCTRTIGRSSAWAMGF